MNLACLNPEAFVLKGYLILLMDKEWMKTH